MQYGLLRRSFGMFEFVGQSDLLHEIFVTHLYSFSHCGRLQASSFSELLSELLSELQSNLVLFLIRSLTFTNLEDTSTSSVSSPRKPSHPLTFSTPHLPVLFQSLNHQINLPSA